MRAWTVPLSISLSLFAASSAYATPTITLTPKATPVVTRVASDGKTAYGCPDRNAQTNSCLVEGTSQGIGYHDCVDDTDLQFSLAMTGVPDANYNLQIWAGTGDCTQAGATNNGATGVCWPVAPNPTMAVVISPLNIRVADIVSGLGEPAPPPQTYTPAVAATTCGAAATSTSNTPTTVTDDAGHTTTTAGESTVTIFFMVFPVGASSSTPAATASYPVKVKLVGPNAVTDLAASSGDGEIILSWTPPAGDNTVQGFDLYAVPDGTALSEAGTETVCNDGSTGTELLDDAGNAVLDDAGNPVFVDDAGNPVTQDAGCTTVPTSPSTASCNGTTGSIDVSAISCPSGGDAGAAICQQVSGVTSAKGSVGNLSNGTQYVAAVAAFDNFGNAGAISTAICSSPQPIDDFWKVYNQQGGNAYCALEVVGKRGGGVAAALMSLVGLVWLRRKRRGSVTK